MSRTTTAESHRRGRVIALGARLRACHSLHLTGFLGGHESVPIAHDPEPEAPLPRILLNGPAPAPTAAIVL